MIASMYTCYLRDEIKNGRFASAEEGLRHYYSLGLRTAQTSDDPACFGISTSEYRALMEEIGIRPVCHTVICSIAAAEPERYEKGLADLREEVKRAAEMGCSMIMVVPNPEDIRDLSEKPAAAERIIETLNLICDEAEPLGVTVTIENFSSKKAPFQTPEECLHILKHVPKLRFVFDTGNFYFPKSDLLAAYELLKNYTIHIHVKDWALVSKENGIPTPDGEYLCSVCPGKGVTQTAELLDRLHADGFSGSLVAEYNGMKPVENELDEMMVYFKRFARSK